MGGGVELNFWYVSVPEKQRGLCSKKRLRFRLPFFPTKKLILFKNFSTRRISCMETLDQTMNKREIYVVKFINESITYINKADRPPKESVAFRTVSRKTT